jgi:hypothetical protein
MATATLLAASAPVYLAYRILPWVAVVCLGILVVAAVLHWQRTRHWCLLAMASGALLMAVCAVASRIVQMQLRPEAQLASGAVRFDTRLLASLTWLAVSGEVIAAVGGVGAIYWAISLRRRK